MALSTPTDIRITSEEYFALFADGSLDPEERTELLEGVVVAVPVPGPLHTSVVHRIHHLLYDRLRGRATVRGQSAFLAGARSVPLPDIAVVASDDLDYQRRHPTEALLLVEVSESSLAQDRITKSRIYAAAGVPEYWIVNLRRDVVETYSAPDRERALYLEHRTSTRGATIALVAFPDVTIPVDDLLPLEPFVD